MQANRAGNAGGDGVDHRLDRRPAHRRGLGNQGRQQRRRPEAGMGVADGLDGRDVLTVVEHDAAAAIDLKIDEARGKQPALEPDGFASGWNVGLGDDIGDRVAADDQRHALQAARAVENLGSDKGGRGHHRVSVTLHRWGG